jgi:hypothetical protein
MHEAPSGSDLLKFARDLLREKLFEQLPAECRYDAMMIENAMAIAARQIEGGEEHDRHDLKGLARLYKVAVRVERQQDQLVELNRRLAEQIRRGELDLPGAQRKAAMEHLLTVARNSVLESNPQYLEQ